jgi:uncharacterized protein
MKARLDWHQFGPWSLVTGASSGIGKEFARQIAAAGINVVLVARREAMLAEVGRNIAKDFHVQHRVVALDLSDKAFLERLAHATKDLDIGLVVSNAGTGNPGEFLKLDLNLLQETLRLNTMAQLNIAHHFGRRLAERQKGGLILVGAMGADIGLPFLANDGAAKAYVHSLGEALHHELKPFGVHVTVVPPGPTATPVLAKFGLDPKTIPMGPLSAEQCVFEGLKSLVENRSRIIPGRLNRVMNALVPAAIKRTMMAKMFGRVVRSKLDVPNARAEA